MITVQTCLIFVVAFAFIFPLSLAIWWKFKSGAKVLPFIVGAIIFTVFAMVLESLVHQVFLSLIPATANFLNNNIVAYAIYGGLMAGLFEELGRFVGFKVLLKKEKYQGKENAIAYGIGHGGVEVILVLGMTYLMYLLVICGVNLTGNEADTKAILDAIGTIDKSMFVVAVIERISAVILHIGLSILVYRSIHEKKIYLLVAIVLHALADIPAVFYQKGYLPIAVVEVVIFVLALGVLIVNLKAFKNIKNEAI